MPWGYGQEKGVAAQAAALLHSPNITRTDPPVFALSLWPNRSLGKVGLRMGLFKLNRLGYALR